MKYWCVIDQWVLMTLFSVFRVCSVCVQCVVLWMCVSLSENTQIFSRVTLTFMSSWCFSHWKSTIMHSDWIVLFICHWMSLAVQSFDLNTGSKATWIVMSAHTAGSSLETGKNICRFTTLSDLSSSFSKPIASVKHTFSFCLNNIFCPVVVEFSVGCEGMFSSDDLSRTEASSEWIYVGIKCVWTN